MLIVRLLLISHLLALFQFSLVSSEKGILQKQYVYNYKNSIGFGAELSLLIYAAWCAEAAQADNRNSSQVVEFCVPDHRRTRWRFMACEEENLACFFNPLKPFMVSFVSSTLHNAHLLTHVFRFESLVLENLRKKFIE
jgi:hypothetical protein